MLESTDNLNNIEASIKSHLDFKERYSDLHPIGVGGAGAVFQVKDNKLDKLVAIKVLHGNVQSKSMIRFQKEARALSMLNHRYIVGVLDFQSSKRGDLFLIMEYVDGSDLEQVVAERGPLPLDDVVKYSIQLCDALVHAHANGVVHRDLKPGNIMIDSNKNVRILDFGIAKLLTVEELHGTISRMGAPMGSPAYMSPEQVRGVDTDERTDVFGLGLLIYIMAAGRSPYDADQVLDYYQNLIGKPPPSLRLWIGESNVAHKLDAIVRKAMESDPNERYQSMTEMRSALASLVTDPVEILQVAAGPTQHSGPGVKRFLLPAILSVAVVGAGMTFFFFSQNSTGTASSGVDKNNLAAAPVDVASKLRKRQTKVEGKFWVGNYRNLENFTFAEKGVTAADLRSLDKSVKKLSLMSLTLNPSIVEAISSLDLNALDLTKTNITDDDLKAIARLENLNWLRLDYTGISSSGIDNLAPLKGKLRMLDFDFCKKIDDKAISSIVKNFPELQSLNIGDTSVTPVGVRNVAKLTRLRELWLSSLLINDDDIKVISKLDLAGLDVSNCKNITDESLRILMPQKRIKFIEITGCPQIHAAMASKWQEAHRNATIRGGTADAINPIAEQVYFEEPEDIK